MIKFKPYIRSKNRNTELTCPEIKVLFCLQWAQNYCFELKMGKITSKMNFLLCLTQQRIELYKPQFIKESTNRQTIKQNSQSLLPPKINGHKGTKVKTKSKLSREEN